MRTFVILALANFWRWGGGGGGDDSTSHDRVSNFPRQCPLVLLVTARCREVKVLGSNLPVARQQLVGRHNWHSGTSCYVYTARPASEACRCNVAFPLGTRRNMKTVQSRQHPGGGTWSAILSACSAEVLMECVEFHLRSPCSFKAKRLGTAITLTLHLMLGEGHSNDVHPFQLELSDENPLEQTSVSIPRTEL
jgi:hypothetical protein